MNRRIAVALFLAALACALFAGEHKGSEELCGPMIANQNVFAVYSCSNGSPCLVGGPVMFNAAATNYSFACDAHHFTWNFGDGTSATGQAATHVFVTPGTYNVSLLISNSGQQVTLDTNVPVTAPPPDCPTLNPNANVYINYAGATSSCSPVVGPCLLQEAIAFQAAAFNYSFSCTVHTFEWNFGDGTTANGMNVTHSFAQPGTYPVALTITTPSQRATLTQNVTVMGMGDPPLISWDFTVQQLFTNGVPIEHGFLFVPKMSPVIAVTWRWDFGDGTIVSGNGAQTHIYADGKAKHTVTLFVVSLPGGVTHVVADPKRRAARH